MRNRIRNALLELMDAFADDLPTLGDDVDNLDPSPATNAGGAP